MDIDGWFTSFGDPVEPGALKSPDAAALVSFVTRYAEHVASLVEVRAADDQELVILDFQTGRPQESAYPIKQKERIGVRFAINGAMPIIYMLRADFPDTEHQQLTIEGSPRAICVDDRIWPEARLTWTPAELVHRALTWFGRAARGELHDARQPIDPVFIGSPLSFLISRKLMDDYEERDLIGVHNTEHQQTLRVIPANQMSGLPENCEPICVAAYRVPPERMTRMKFAPNNLASLADILEVRGINLFDDLAARFSGWLRDGESAAWRLNSRLVIIVEMPVVSPRDEQRDGTDLRAYMAERCVGDIAVALGVGLPSGRTAGGSRVGFVPAVVPTSVDTDAMRAIEMQVAEVHYEFDRTLATQLAGRAAEDTRKAVLVGAGAIGSHMSDALVREGRFFWTVVDDDYLLPHNLSRHTGRQYDVTKNKAHVVADSLSATLGPEASTARFIAANVLSAPLQRDAIDSALSGSDLIVDATASVLAERFLSDHAASARRVSIFFNPAGSDAVLLAEPADRSVTLRDLEAQYLGLAGTDERIASHLSAGEETFAYTGACRAITNLIPESRVMTLSGLVAGGLGKVVDVPDGVIRIWSLDDDGSVDVLSFAPEPVTRLKAGDWMVTFDAGLIGRIKEMRAAKLPNETGGILLGVVDIPAKSIHLVSAGAAPADSREAPAGFTRGTVGVQEHIDRVFERTRGQVRYIGEWHSHPPRAAALPSMTDFVQIDWLATLFDMDTLPALMLIAGDRDVSIILAKTQAVPLE